MSLQKTLVLAVLLCCAVLYVVKIEMPKQDAEKNKGVVFRELDANRVAEVTVKRKNAEAQAETFTLVNKAKDEPAKTDAEKAESIEGGAIPDFNAVKGWQLSSPAGVEADSGAVSALVSALKDLKLEEPLPAPSEDDLKTFGLAPAEMDVQIKLKDGTSKLVQVGAKNEYLMKRYAKVDGDANVYIVPETLYLSANKSNTEFRDKLPIKFMDVDVKSIEVTSAAGPAVLEQSPPGTWKITSPRALPGSPSAVADLLNGLRDLRAAEFFDDGMKKPADYALDKPLASFALTFNDTRPKLFVKVGKKISGEGATKNEAVYFTFDGAPSVYKLPNDSTKRLTKGVDDLREKKVFAFDTTKAKGLRFQPAGTKEVVLEQSGDSWKVNGLEGDSSFVSEIVTNLAGIEAHSFTTEKADFSKPTLTVTLTLSGEGESATPITKVLFVGAPTKADATLSYARLGSDGEVFLLKDEVVKRIAPREETLLKPVPTAAVGTAAALP